MLQEGAFFSNSGVELEVWRPLPILKGDLPHRRCLQLSKGLWHYAVEVAILGIQPIPLDVAVGLVVMADLWKMC